MSTSVLIYCFWKGKKTVEPRAEKCGSFYRLREMERGILAAFHCRLVIMTHVRYERITAAFEIHKKEEGNNEKGKRM